MSEHDIQKLVADHAALRDENAVLKEELALAQEQLAWLKKQIFGRKTEQTSVITGSDMQLSFFPVTDDENSYVADRTITVPKHKRKKKRTHCDWMSELPVEEVLHKEDDPKCDKCGSDMTEIGEDKYDELIYTPAKFHIRRHIVKVYKCIKCGTAPEVSTEPCNMATTKLFPITATERKAISYIADGSKTDNGRLISTFCCSSDPAQASKDFTSVRACGTGKNKILSQHFIQSFKPGEITPERALEVGEELCEKFLKGQYQYYLAVHVDKAHVHLHVIFNNYNIYDYKTFETHEDQGSKKERAWKKLFDLSDEICKRHHLSVIQNPELGKGKKRWEWMLDQEGLSWKTKLKKAINQVVMNSEDFEDFLTKCADYGVIVDYNPDHKIDLKFMLAEQKERNPRVRFIRARTLGGYYETETIKKRIAQFVGGMSYTPRARIKAVEQTPQNKFVQDAIDRGNMKIASIAKISLLNMALKDFEVKQR